MGRLLKEYKAKTCIDCGEPEDIVEFFREGGRRTWQYTNRCRKCEELYWQEFHEKYPSTKTEFKYRKLNKKEKSEYKKWRELWTTFEDWGFE